MDEDLIEMDDDNVTPINDGSTSDAESNSENKESSSSEHDSDKDDDKKKSVMVRFVVNDEELDSGFTAPWKVVLAVVPGASRGDLLPQLVAEMNRLKERTAKKEDKTDYVQQFKSWCERVFNIPSSTWDSAEGMKETLNTVQTNLDTLVNAEPRVESIMSEVSTVDNAVDSGPSISRRTARL